MVIPRKLRRLAAIFATHEDCSTGSCCWKRRFSFGSSLKRTRRQKRWTKCFVTGILGRWSWLACEEFKREPNPRCRTSRSTHVLFPVISKCTGVRPVSRYFFARVSAPPYRARLLAFESVIPNAKSEIEREREEKERGNFSWRFIIANWHCAPCLETVSVVFKTLPMEWNVDSRCSGEIKSHGGRWWTRINESLPGVCLCDI